MQEWLVLGGRLRAAVVLGVLFAVVVGYSQFALDGSARDAYGGMAAGAVAGVVLVALNRWPGWWKVDPLSRISAPDRLAVLRAVHRGESVADPRLAPNVLKLADVVEDAVRKEQQTPRILLLATMVLPMIAIRETLAGLVPRAVASWVAAVVVGCLSFYARLAGPKRLYKAQRAAKLAQEQVQGWEDK